MQLGRDPLAPPREHYRMLFPHLRSKTLTMRVAHRQEMVRPGELYPMVRGESPLVPLVVRTYKRSDIGGSMDGPTLRRRDAYPTKKTGPTGPFDGPAVSEMLLQVHRDLAYLLESARRVDERCFVSRVR